MAKIRAHIIGFIVWVLYRLIAFTWRVEIHEPEKLKEHVQNGTNFLLANFHGDEGALLFLARRYRLSSMISTSKDGEIMNVVFGLMGGKASRGSSTRGGVSALKGLIEFHKSGRSSSISIDGPKGPVYEVKPGIFELSRLLKAEIFAGSAYAESAWHFPKSWNKAFFPKPFARVVIVWTGPFGPVTKTDDPRSPELAKSLQNQLFAAKQQAANLFGVSKG